MKKLTTLLGYSGAALSLATIAGAMVLLPAFTRGVAATGVKIDPARVGGELVRTLPRGAYHIDVYQVVRPQGLLDQREPFVQLAWGPLPALPQRVEDEVDVDGDGLADVRVRFEVPPPPARLRVDVVALRPGLRAMSQVGIESVCALIARLPDKVIVRIPLEP